MVEMQGIRGTILAPGDTDGRPCAHFVFGEIRARQQSTSARDRTSFFPALTGPLDQPRQPASRVDYE